MLGAQIRSVALFFYFTYLDKSLAVKASSECLFEIENRIKKNPKTNIGAILVFASEKVWKKYSRKKNIKSKDFEQVAEGWVVPEGLKLETWRQFVKEGDPQQVLAVIWSELLNIDEKDIAEGLGVSEGSVRYRVGRGLKYLGQLSQPLTGALDAQA